MPDLSDSIYTPAEDTYFLEDHVRDLRGGCALDVGCSSGYLASSLSGSFDFVVGTDISLRALIEPGCWTGDRICCDGAGAISCRFDLIVCNPPYLATDRILVASTDGGPGGIPVPLKMIRSAIPLLKPGGRLLFVTSSLSDYGTLIKRIVGLGARAGILARKKIFFEELILVEVRPKQGLEHTD